MRIPFWYLVLAIGIRAAMCIVDLINGEPAAALIKSTIHIVAQIQMARTRYQKGILILCHHLLTIGDNY